MDSVWSRWLMGTTYPVPAPETRVPHQSKDTDETERLESAGSSDVQVGLK